MELTDLDRERKKHLRRRTAKRVAAVFVASAMAFVLYVMRFEIASQGVGVLLADALAALFDNHGYPVLLDSPPSQLICTGRRAVTVSQSELSVYNSAGNRVIFDRLTAQNPLACAAGKRLLVYEQGGYDLSVRSGDAVLYKNTYDSPIYAAALSANGVCAVSTGAVGYQSQLVVLDNRYDRLFEWASSGDIITVLALDDAGGLVAAGGIYSDKGALASSLRLFDLSGGSERWKIELTDELLLGVRVCDDGSLIAVSDRSVTAISASGEITGRFAYEGDPLGAYLINKDAKVTVALGDYAASHQMRLVQLDANAAVRTEAVVPREIKSLTGYQNELVAFTGDWAVRYSEQLEQLRMIETPDASHAEVIGDFIYYTTAQELRRAAIR